jgi:hypothetical protein
MRRKGNSVPVGFQESEGLIGSTRRLAVRKRA